MREKETVFLFNGEKKRRYRIKSVFIWNIEAVNFFELKVSFLRNTIYKFIDYNIKYGLFLFTYPIPCKPSPPRPSKLSWIIFITFHDKKGCWSFRCVLPNSFCPYPYMFHVSSKTFFLAPVIITLKTKSTPLSLRWD